MLLKRIFLERLEIHKHSENLTKVTSGSISWILNIIRWQIAAYGKTMHESQMEINDWHGSPPPHLKIYQRKPEHKVGINKGMEVVVWWYGKVCWGLKELMSRFSRKIRWRNSVVRIFGSDQNRGFSPSDWSDAEEASGSWRPSPQTSSGWPGRPSGALCTRSTGRWTRPGTGPSPRWTGSLDIYCTDEGERFTSQHDAAAAMLHCGDAVCLSLG